MMWSRFSSKVGGASRLCASQISLTSRRRLNAWRLPAARTFAAAVEEKEATYASGDLSGYRTFKHEGDFLLRSGKALPEMKIAYETWGQLSAAKDNVILLQTGMSASSHAASHAENPSPGWWENFIGPGRTLDTNLFYVICTNNLGGCYGSSGPSSPHPEDSRPWGSRFPRFEVQDQVAAQFALLDHLGVDKLHACVGSSLGGMQSVCAAATYPDRVQKLVSISACARSHASSMAFRHCQRQAVMRDPHWNKGDYYDGPLPAAGLQLARQIGTITYRSGEEWGMRFGQSKATNVEPTGLGGSSKPYTADRADFQMEQYLLHQGKKWVGNYDPNSLIWISKAMDGFSMEKVDKSGNLSLAEGLKKATMPALVIGVQYDVLFPVWQQKEIADTLREIGNRHVTYYELDAVYGHDAFLLDAASIGPAVKGLIEQEPFGAQHLWQNMAMNIAHILKAVAAGGGGQADVLRTVFRTLAQGADKVEKDHLRHVVKLAWEGRVSAANIDRIFDTKLTNSAVGLQEFMTIRKDLARSETEVYLP